MRIEIKLLALRNVFSSWHYGNFSRPVLGTNLTVNVSPYLSIVIRLLAICYEWCRSEMLRISASFSGTCFRYLVNLPNMTPSPVWAAIIRATWFDFLQACFMYSPNAPCYSKIHSGAMRRLCCFTTDHFRAETKSWCSQNIFRFSNCFTKIYLQANNNEHFFLVPTTPASRKNLTLYFENWN